MVNSNNTCTHMNAYSYLSIFHLFLRKCILILFSPSPVFCFLYDATRHDWCSAYFIIIAWWLSKYRCARIESAITYYLDTICSCARGNKSIVSAEYLTSVRIDGTEGNRSPPVSIKEREVTIKNSSVFDAFFSRVLSITLAYMSRPMINIKHKNQVHTFHWD